MVVVKTIEEFHEKNEQELRDFMVYKTGIYDKNLIDDAIQEFYLRLITSNALERFDANELKYGELESLFETWICNIFCWLLPQMKKRNFRSRFEVHSFVHVKINNKVIQIDVWDILGNEEEGYDIAKGYSNDQIYNSNNISYEHLLSSFLRYLKSHVQNSEIREKMIEYINYKKDGMKDIDIAKILKLSNSSMNILKSKIRQKEKSWKEQCLQI